jgi:uncharacterized protein YjbI with pentapeptide repeats
MSDQDNRKVATLQWPTTNDPKAWKAYWEAQGQSWRTEPEIDAERQKYLEDRRSITPDIEKGIYSFKDIEPKLNRADIEWLLATHDNGQGPVDWNDENQRGRRGLDIRGADLRGAKLQQLPLACLYAGLTLEEHAHKTEEQRENAGALMEGADLSKAQLQGAFFIRARLQKAKFSKAQLERAFFNYAQLQEANFVDAQLQRADFGRAQLQRANLREANLREAHLFGTHLQEARLAGAQLQRANLSSARLQGAELVRATFNDENHVGPYFVDIEWGDTNLAVIDWSQLTILGDEHWTRGKKGMREVTKRYGHAMIEFYEKNPQIKYQEALRANRQISVVLQNQGLNEDAARFAYRAQRIQRILARREHRFGQYLFSWFLDILSGYGYRPRRSLCWYFAVIIGFALAYYLFGGLSLYPPDAFVFSLTSFHGRGFFPGLEHTTSLHDPLVVLAALEAVVGLFIEISFIATFTQRFFGR